MVIVNSISTEEQYIDRTLAVVIKCPSSLNNPHLVFKFGYGPKLPGRENLRYFNSSNKHLKTVELYLTYNPIPYARFFLVIFENKFVFDN